MKLIYCPECNDIVRLMPKKRSCACRKSWGRYVGAVDARIGGKAIPLGINNVSFLRALRNRQEEGFGEDFSAFVIPEKCLTIEREEDV